MKDESEASTAPAAISRRERGKVTPCGLRLDGGVKAKLRQPLQQKVARSAAASCTARVADSKGCQR